MVTFYVWLVSLGHCNNFFYLLLNAESIHEHISKKIQNSNSSLRVVSPPWNFSHLEEFRSFIYINCCPYSSSYKAKSKTKPKKQRVFLSLCSFFECRWNADDSTCCPAVRNWLFHLLIPTQRGHVSLLFLMCTHSHRLSTYTYTCTLFVCLSVVLFNGISHPDWKIFLLLSVWESLKNCYKTFLKCWQPWI